MLRDSSLEELAGLIFGGMRSHAASHRASQDTLRFLSLGTGRPQLAHNRQVAHPTEWPEFSDACHGQTGSNQFETITGFPVR